MGIPEIVLECINQVREGYGLKPLQLESGFCSYAANEALSLRKQSAYGIPSHLNLRNFDVHSVLVHFKLFIEDNFTKPEIIDPEVDVPLIDESTDELIGNALVTTVEGILPQLFGVIEAQPQVQAILRSSLTHVGVGCSWDSKGSCILLFYLGELNLSVTPDRANYVENSNRLSLEATEVLGNCQSVKLRVKSSSSNNDIVLTHARVWGLHGFPSATIKFDSLDFEKEGELKCVSEISLFTAPIVEEPEGIKNITTMFAVDCEAEIPLPEFYSAADFCFSHYLIDLLLAPSIGAKEPHLAGRFLIHIVDHDDAGAESQLESSLLTSEVRVGTFSDVSVRLAGLMSQPPEAYKDFGMPVQVTPGTLARRFPLIASAFQRPGVPSVGQLILVSGGSFEEAQSNLPTGAELIPFNISHEIGAALGAVPIGHGSVSPSSASVVSDSEVGELLKKESSEKESLHPSLSELDDDSTPLDVDPPHLYLAMALEGSLSAVQHAYLTAFACLPNSDMIPPISVPPGYDHSIVDVGVHAINPADLASSPSPSSLQSAVTGTVRRTVRVVLAQTHDSAAAESLKYSSGLIVGVESHSSPTDGLGSELLPAAHACTDGVLVDSSKVDLSLFEGLDDGESAESAESDAVLVASSAKNEPDSFDQLLAETVELAENLDVLLADRQRFEAFVASLLYSRMSVDERTQITASLQHRQNDDHLRTTVGLLNTRFNGASSVAVGNFPHASGAGRGGATAAAAAGVVGGAVGGGSALAQDKLEKLRVLVRAVAQERASIAKNVEKYASAALALQKRLDSREARLLAVSSAFMDFRRSVARAAVDSHTLKPLPAQLIEGFEKEIQERQANAGKVQLRNIYSESVVASMTRRLANSGSFGVSGAGAAGKASMGVVEIDELRLESLSLLERIEQRQEELAKLRAKTSGAVQVLTHMREKNFFLSNEESRYKADLKELDSLLTEERLMLANAKKKRDALRKSLETAKNLQGFAFHDQLAIDYTKTMNQVMKLKNELQEVQDKYNDVNKSNIASRARTSKV